MDAIRTQIAANASKFCLQPWGLGWSGRLFLLNYHVSIWNWPFEIGWHKDFIVILTKFHASLIALKFCGQISLFPIILKCFVDTYYKIEIWKKILNVLVDISGLVSILIYFILLILISVRFIDFIQNNL